MAPSDRPLRERRNLEGRGRCGRDLCWSQSRGSAQECEARGSRLELESKSNSCPSIEFGRAFTTGVMVLAIDVSVDSSLPRMALRRGLLATEGSHETELDRLLEELNCYKLENVKSEKSILEKDTAMKAIFKCLVDTDQ